MIKNNDKKNPFKTPEGYFDNVEDKLVGRISDESSNVLDAERRLEDGFKTPKGYFDSLQDNINKRLTEDTKVVPLRSFKKYYVAVASIAAAALIVFGLFWDTTKDINFTDLADSDIEAYFENNNLELSSYEIAEVIQVDELEISDFLDNPLEEEHILEYLNDTLDDFEELNIEENE